VQEQAYGKIQPYIQGGNLVALDGKIAGLANIDKAALAGATGRTDGKIYGVPFATQTIQMFYNKDIFAKLHLSVPKNWQDFLAVSQALKDANIVPMSVGAKDTFLLPLISEAFMSSIYGGLTFEKNLLDGSTTFEDPAYVKAISTFKSLQKYMPDNVVGVSYTDSQALFFSGGAGMYPGGSFELGFFHAQNPKLNLGVFPVPPAPGAASTVALTPGYADGSWSLNKASTHQKDALELLDWMASKQFGQMFANDLSQLSPIKGVTFSDPLLQQMADNFVNHGAPYLLITDFRWGTPSGTDVMAPGLQKLLLGSTDPTQLATTLQQGISAWFTPKK
jgi:raffinose/stachyose/melibiose transport system substrate-binding protein